MSHLLPTISALGTTWWIEIFDESTPDRLDTAHTSVQALLFKFEIRYSRFRADSNVSILNHTGLLLAPEPEFLELLHYGLAAYDRTEGIFNLMVGATLVASGYDSSYSFTAKPHTDTIPNPHQVLSLSPDQIALSAGMIDLGGYGKGYAIDVVAKYLREELGFKFFLVNGGGDMFGTSNHGESITLYLEHPLATKTYLATTTIFEQGFAASSPHKRAWKSSGKDYTHIIDTHKSKNIGDKPDAIFITAPSAVDADMFATTALIMSLADFTFIANRELLGVASYTDQTKRLEANERFRVDAS